MTLLALAGLKPGDRWADSTTPRLGVQKIMDWSARIGPVAEPPVAGKISARRPCVSGLITDSRSNPDNLNIATNSQLNEYCLSDEGAQAVRSWARALSRLLLRTFSIERRRQLKRERKPSEPR